VKRIEGRKKPLEVPDDDGRGFAYRCTWTVEGTVEHWGHVHTRTNQYRALFTVQARQDAWKITDLQVLGEERVKFETNVRRFRTSPASRD
jgi:hypothetical protein